MIWRDNYRHNDHLFSHPVLGELWYYFRRRSEYDEVALKMRYGEFGGQEMSARARLTFGYPVFIIVFGAASIGVLWDTFKS